MQPTQRRRNGYTTVVPDGLPNYVSPHEAGCLAAHRYMAVHRVDGGGWGIVDRRSGRLLIEGRPDEHRYESWQVVLSVVRGLNASGPA